MRCEGGAATETSTRPADGLTCACPDGLHCVAYLDRADPAPDLRYLPEGGPAPGPEIADRRMCVRACSEEGNCSADHTCRPAAVTRADGRLDAIAVCYPNVLTETSTTTRVVQPIPGVCRQDRDCGPGSVCQVQLDVVPDHPVAPFGAAWGRRLAMVSRCASRTGLQLRDPPSACTLGSECSTGVCAGGRCRVPCDPADVTSCGRRICRGEVVERLADGRRVGDRVHICEPN